MILKSTRLIPYWANLIHFGPKYGNPVSRPHRIDEALFYFTHYFPFLLFVLYVVTLTVLFLFLGASIVCVHKSKFSLVII